MQRTKRQFLQIAGLGVVAVGLPSLLRAEGRPIRIRGIFETPIEEPFVTQLNNAMLRIAEEGGHDYEYSESVKATDYSRVLRRWCEEGVELIVGDAYGTEQICRRVAESYPDSAFVMGSALGPVEPNFSTFFGVNTDSAYLAGMLAAGMSTTGNIGAVSGIAVPSTYGLLNAYKAGAKFINPDVRLSASYIGSFFDPPKAKESTLAMAEQGVDVVFAERVGVIEAAAERDIIAIGNMTDQAGIAPDTVITSSMWDPYTIIAAAVKTAQEGTVVANDYSSMENVANGVNYLSAFGTFDNKIPAELKAAIDKRTEEIRSGAFVVPYDESVTSPD